MIGSIIDLIVGPLGAVLGIVVAGLIAFISGRKSGEAKAEIKRARDYQKTRKEMDNVEDQLSDDPSHAREWLRKRGQSKRDL